MTIKDFFKDLWSYKRDIHNLIYEIASLEVQKVRISSQIYGPSKTSGGVLSSSNYLVDKLVDKQKQLESLENKIEKLKIEKTKEIKNILDDDIESQIIILKYIDGLTIKEIASILSFSESYTKKKKSIAIKRLEESLVNENRYK